MICLNTDLEFVSIPPLIFTRGSKVQNLAFEASSFRLHNSQKLFVSVNCSIVVFYNNEPLDKLFFGDFKQQFANDTVTGYRSLQVSRYFHRWRAFIAEHFLNLPISSSANVFWTVLYFVYNKNEIFVWVHISHASSIATRFIFASRYHSVQYNHYSVS